MESSQYLKDLQIASKKTNKQLVEQLGYININKGLRRLKQIIDNPPLYTHMVRNLVFILGGSKKKLDKCLEADLREEFVPTAHIVPVKRIPKYPLYSRYIREKELRIPLGEFIGKVRQSDYMTSIELKDLRKLRTRITSLKREACDFNKVQLNITNRLRITLNIGGE